MRSVLFIAVCVAGLLGNHAQTPNDEIPVVDVQASVKELAVGFQHWLHKHPQGSTTSTGGGLSYVVHWPVIDIYNEEGRSVYYGDDLATNLTVINALPHSIPAERPLKTQNMRPTLAEAKAMFPEISAAERTSSAYPPKYTVFVVSYGERPGCKEQDVAIDRLKQRLRGPQVALIEVHVSST